MMFDFLVKDNKIDISDADRAFIKAMITSQPEKCLYVVVRIAFFVGFLINISREKEKPFLFEIVSNSRNGIDVDKFVPLMAIILLNNNTDFLLDSTTFYEIQRLLASTRIFPSHGSIHTSIWIAA
jgi:hypothetical protein